MTLDVKSQQSLRSVLSCRSNVLVYGAPYLDIRSEVLNLLDDGVDYEILDSTSSINDIRLMLEARSRVSTGYVIIDGVDSLSENSQDGLLKSVEDSAGQRFVLISYDNGLVSDALLSRFSVRISVESMIQSGDDLVSQICSSSQLRSLWDSDPSYHKLMELVRCDDWSKRVLLTPILPTMKQTKFSTHEKHLIGRILAYSTRGLAHHSTMCNLASDFLKLPTMNFGLHLISASLV